MAEDKKAKPGDGLRSLQVTNLFKILNVELYVKPNKVIMGIGAGAFLICLSYITYMRYKYANLGYYPVVDPDGSEQYYKRKSNWD